MEHEGNRPHRDSDDEYYSDEQDRQLGSRIAPEMPIPATVLLTELDNGTLLLQGRPDGPRIWLDPPDAGPLKRELAAVFERIEAAIDRLEPDVADDDQGEAP